MNAGSERWPPSSQTDERQAGSRIAEGAAGQVISTLRDESRVVIRPVAPDDREMLAEGFGRLSAEWRYRRFLTPMPELSERQLNYLTLVDHHDHEALVTVDPVTGECVGVARFVRTAPGVAELLIDLQ